jgi:hypothetical protein
MKKFVGRDFILKRSHNKEWEGRQAGVYDDEIDENRRGLISSRDSVMA